MDEKIAPMHHKRNQLSSLILKGLEENNSSIRITIQIDTKNRMNKTITLT